MGGTPSQVVRPWERRLADLWLLLERCHATYMEPELFRLNTNQFLQTSRTVTFIIQKHKDSIPDFEAWYRPLVAAWASDAVIDWAKDSRNTIEKEGDLDLHSSLELSLFSSYLVEQDLTLVTGRNELLRAGTKKLVRFAQKNVPSNFIDSTAIKIERRWIANTLPTWELLHAFAYIYSTLYQMCQKLAAHLGSTINSDIPDPTSLLAVREAVRHVQYVKLSDLRTHYQHTIRMNRDPDFKPPAEIEASGHELQSDFALADSPEKMLHVLSRMAAMTFEHFGNHVPMLFLYDRDMKPVDALTAAFVDQVDKYIFWRNLADRVVIRKAAAVAFIGEAWMRDIKDFYSVPMHKLPIIGERLFVNILDSTGTFRGVDWEIIRPHEDAKPTLKRLPESDTSQDKVPFTYAPIFRAFGLPYPEHFREVPPLPEDMQKRVDRSRLTSQQ